MEAAKIAQSELAIQEKGKIAETAASAKKEKYEEPAKIILVAGIIVIVLVSIGVVTFYYFLKSTPEGDAIGKSYNSAETNAQQLTSCSVNFVTCKCDRIC